VDATWRWGPPVSPPLSSLSFFSPLHLSLFSPIPLLSPYACRHPPPTRLSSWPGPWRWPAAESSGVGPRRSFCSPSKRHWPTAELQLACPAALARTVLAVPCLLDLLGVGGRHGPPSHGVILVGRHAAAASARAPVAVVGGAGPWTSCWATRGRGGGGDVVAEQEDGSGLARRAEGQMLSVMSALVSGKVAELEHAPVPEVKMRGSEPVRRWPERACTGACRRGAGGARGWGAWRSAEAGRPVRKTVDLARSRCGGGQVGGARSRQSSSLLARRLGPAVEQ
jgi:hypothetical protein